MILENFKMAGEKTIPIRGVKQDWYGDKEQEILNENKKYAKISIKNNLLGSPDFEQFKDFLVKPVLDESSRGKITTKKPKNNDLRLKKK